jgi:hypothetical protein
LGFVARRKKSIEQFRTYGDDQPPGEYSDDPDHEFGEADSDTVSTACISETAASRSSLSSSCSSQSGDGRHSDAEEHPLPFPRYVRFTPAVVSSEHEITPYSQIYGTHPRFFDFDRKGRMQQTDEGVAEELRMAEEHGSPPLPRLLPPLGPEAVAAGGMKPGAKLVVDGDGQQWLAWKQEREAVSR